MNAAQLQARLDQAGVEYFTASEFLRLRQTGEIVDLPDEYADAASQVLLLADEVRRRYGAPVALGNGYRPPAYNKLVGGAERSQHLFGAAVDLDPLAGREAEFQAIAARVWIDYPERAAGLGIYSGGRAHLDVFSDVGGAERRYWGGEPDKWRAKQAISQAQQMAGGGSGSAGSVIGGIAAAALGLYLINRLKK